MNEAGSNAPIEGRCVLLWRMRLWLALLWLGANACRKDPPVSIVELRPSSSLPTTQLGWLSLKDHFVATVGEQAGQGQPLGPLLVLADATFSPHSRFPLHPHRDIEILSVVISGEMSHHGDGANGMTVKPRGAQLISSRNGMRHAEGNETDDEVRMLQIWVQPYSTGGEAAYFYRQLPDAPGIHLLAGDEGMPLRNDAKVWWLDVEGERRVTVPVGRKGYALGLTGAPRVGASVLHPGDGAVISTPGEVRFTGGGAVLWLDVR
jgi:redox-sensitive bicupin YhaK (pirin superfamily)